MLAKPDNKLPVDDPNEKEQDDSEMKNNETDKNKINHGGIYGLFNALQFERGKLFIDIRPKSQHKKFKIIHFINIPCGILDDDDCDETLIQKVMTMPEIIYCIGNQSIINQKTDIKFCKYFQSVICDTFETNIPIIIIKSPFETFKERFPYLCYRMYGMDIEKYPNQIINNQLFLGDMGHATTKEVLQDLKITHIINMTKTKNTYKGLKIKYLQCPMYDSEEDEIQQYFNKVIGFIEHALSGNKNGNIINRILVHCHAGVSRSSSIIIAYLMKTRKWTYENAYNYTIKRREIIQPNDGFVNQLKLYEKNGFAEPIETKQ